MKYLEKIWVRGLISFFVGGVIPEWIFISASDLNSHRGNSTGLISPALIVMVYMTLTAMVKTKKSLYNFIQTYLFNLKEKEISISRAPSFQCIPVEPIRTPCNRSFFVK